MVTGHPLAMSRGGRVVLVASAHPRDLLATGNLLAALALLAAVALVILGLRRLPPAYSAFSLVSLLFPLLEPNPLRPLLSLPRLLVVTFPLFIVLALLTERRPVLRHVLMGLSTLALIWLTARFMRDLWVA